MGYVIRKYKVMKITQERKYKYMKRNTFLQYIALTAMLFIALPGMSQTSDGTKNSSCSAVAPASTGVQIGGAVYGGGRRADVGGDSYVAVFNAREIAAVYGGNDIAGVVNGAHGAAVQIGCEDASTPFVGNQSWSTRGITQQTLKIGSVYGGGNGFYIYPAPIGDTVNEGDLSFVVADGETYELKYHRYTANGDTLILEETLPAASYSVPSIQKTTIHVYSDKTYIDSLFGGAKNAFVGTMTAGAASTVSADVNIHNGTIYSLFGGNNYGGVIANTLDILVENTTTLLPYSSACLGVTHGIKYLFGGGNRVGASHVTIHVEGGQIDTAFAGGNMATVAQTSFSLNAIDDNLIYGTRFQNDGTFTAFNGNVITSISTPTVSDYPFNAKGGRMVAGSYVSVPEDATNVYNIRTLFGGNNIAAMHCLPQLTLTSGGVGTIYGGGNAGDMKYEGTLTRPGLAGVLPSDTLISTYVVLNSPTIYADFVYGGCQKACVDYDTYVRIKNGYVGNVFGGCNISGDVGSYRTIEQFYPVFDVNGNPTSATQTLQHSAQSWVFIETGSRIFHNVFGGGNGYYHCTDGTRYVDGKSFVEQQNYLGLKIPTINRTNVLLSGGHVYGNLYAGGNMAPVGYGVNYDYATDCDVCPDTLQGYALLRLYSAEATHAPFVKGDVYGGGNMASVYGITDFHVYGNVIINGSVYGGNDKLGRVVNSGHEHYADGSRVASDNATLLSNSNASSYVKVTGMPQIRAIYGGGNGNYNYDNVDFADSLCYAGTDDLPSQPSAFVDIHVDNGAYIAQVYGGGNNVTVSDSVTVLVNATVRGDNATQPLIGTVFGGCNRAAMTAVPNVVLMQGRVNDVYGGGNAGDMLGMKRRGDHHGVSTYVHLNSNDIKLDGTLYGGCNQANVSGSTFVWVENGAVDTLFGGNNISGLVSGQTHVQIDGGTVTQIYGGSNGFYTYVPHPQETDDFLVYPFGTTDFSDNNIVGRGTMPNCSDTYVMLHGGTIQGNVYGGGYAGSCNNTLVEVKGDALLSNEAYNSAIFGGGRGDSEHLGFCASTHPHLGTVTGSTQVQLYSMHSDSKINKVYGGGDAGDAANTHVVLHNTMEHHFAQMYGGCRAADVSGIATMELNGILKEDFVNVDTVYGGNDIVGHVNTTHLTINSGRYHFAFGAGNGDYNYKELYTSLHGTAIEGVCLDSIPSNGQVIFTINDGSTTGHDNTLFTGFVYGGGNMGLVGSRDIVRNSIVDESQYGFIQLNIHGGYFAQRVFAGARGKAFYGGDYTPYFGRDKEQNERLQLVYGLKEVNMDGGKIMFSLHGGSEFVDDGYPYECKGKDYNNSDVTVANTTLRPSGIVNIVGGTVVKSLYGGGYEGTIHGSVYVNVGRRAVENSEVWSKRYGKAEDGYINPLNTVSFVQYKPNTDGTESSVSALTPDHLSLEASVYGGSDWGDAGATPVFSTPGVYGGETTVYIDGRGYITSNMEGDGKTINISQSIIGAGTSTEGGDVNRKVQLFNYGANQCLDATPLNSIQRADTVLLDHAYITLAGQQDAYFAYPSQNYSLIRIRNFIMRDDNYINIMAPAQYIDTVESLKKIAQNSYDYYAVTDRETTPTHSFCDLSQSSLGCPILDDDGSRNVFMIGSGAYLYIKGYRDDNLADNNHNNNNTDFGPVLGYCYLGSSLSGMEAYVYARIKTSANTADERNDGFWSLCDSVNVRDDYSGGAREIHYHNSTDVDEPFRVWHIGAEPSTGADTVRNRNFILVACQNPASHSGANFWVHDADCNTVDAAGDIVSHDGRWKGADNSIHEDYAFSVMEVPIPPAKAGTYYTFSNISIDAENGGEMNLVSAAWMPNDSVNNDGEWIYVNNGTGVVDGRGIEEYPSYTFGLMCYLESKYEDYSSNSNYYPYVVLSGHGLASYVENQYRTPTLSQDYVMSNLKFVLTYNTNFDKTLLRKLTFTLREHKPDGTTAPIYITVEIATVLDDFHDFRGKALAMYNGGIEHKYDHKVVIPAAFEQRDVYLTGVEWTSLPTCTDLAQPAYYLTDTVSNNVAPYTDVNGVEHREAKEDKRYFSVTMNVSENVDDNTTTIGWYAYEGEENDNIPIFDIRSLSNRYNTSLGNAPLSSGSAIFTTTAEVAAATAGCPTTNEDTVAWIKSGQHIGVLDGRATAAIDLTSFYNGNLIYDDCDALGEVTLKFAYVGRQNPRGNNVGTFEIKFTQWSRQSADTIYVATDSRGTGVTRTAPDGSSITLRGFDYELSLLDPATQQDLILAMQDNNKKGKEPKLYLKSFVEALTPNDPYIEGDVIAVIDTMKIPTAGTFMIKGMDDNHNEYSRVQIIRYSGSHYQLPGEYGAYRGPLIVLADQAHLSMSNVWLNGSGFTQRKTAGIGTGESTTFNGTTYYQNARWEPDTILATDPMILVQDAAVFNTQNVRITNAISQANSHGSHSAPQQQGAAIALVKTRNDATPRVVLGTATDIYNNATVNHAFANSIASGVLCNDPGNRGAAIHVKDGILQIGTGVDGTAVQIHANYYMWNAPRLNASTLLTEDGQGALTDGTNTYTWNAEEKAWYNGTVPLALPATVTYELQNMTTLTHEVEEGVSYQYYAFKDEDQAWVRNNVSLFRAPIATGTADAKEMSDSKSNHIVFVNTLAKETKIGITKWFPGGSPSYARSIRDTIGVAFHPNSLDAAENAFANGNFFADSAAYDIRTFHHKLVNPYTIYLHRCATFRANDNDDIAYHWDADAYCPNGSDSLTFRLQHGFLPYTYTWYGYKTKLDDADNRVIDAATAVKLREKRTVATVEDERNPSTSAAWLAAARVDTLALFNVDMPGGVVEDYYYYMVTGTDLANCKQERHALVKMVKSNTATLNDDANFLGRTVSDIADMVLLPQNADNSDHEVLTRLNSPYTLNATPTVDSSLYHYRGEIWSQQDNAKVPITVHKADTNKYLRVFRAYELTARVEPSYTYGTVYQKNLSGQGNTWIPIAGLSNPINPTPEELATEVLTKVILCPGDVLSLHTEAQRNAQGQYLYDFDFWSFDPTAGQTADFVMPEADAFVAAYYSPRDYWYQTVTEHPGAESYEVDYRGTVYIKDEEGLAWFISTVNGLNNQQAQTFVFDTVCLQAPLYDMSAHRWTPLGNINHPFRGIFKSANPNGTLIKGIYCDEEELPYVGFFGCLDSARIGHIDTSASAASEYYRIKLSDSYFNGRNYVGVLAAWASNGTQAYNTEMANVTVSGNNAVGGMFGYAEQSVVKFNTVGVVTDTVFADNDGNIGGTYTNATHNDNGVYYFGAPVHLGGIVGLSRANAITNNAVQAHDAMYAQPLYVGGIAGKTEGVQGGNTPTLWQRLFGGRAKSGGDIHSYIVNNYAGMRTSNESFRVGGLVGDASHVMLRNNYVYGNIKAFDMTGSLVAVTGRNVGIDHCFYNSAMGGRGTTLGIANATPRVSDTSAFSGIGNQVRVEHAVEGIDNVTVLLNRYVREQGDGALASWRSDLRDENSGFPIFGTPDTVPVYSYFYDAACDSYEWNGTTYQESGVYLSHRYNDVLKTDSISMMVLAINHSTFLSLSDSVLLGEGYNANGFRLTADEIRHLVNGTLQGEVQILQLTDSLLTEHGCDSVVSLMLTVYKGVGIDEPSGDAASAFFEVQVYPNPTTGMVTVESEGLQQIEVYDNVSRKVMQSTTQGDKHQMNLSTLSAGAYYVRVTTDKGVAVKKVIKK